MTNVAFDSGNSIELDLVEGASSTLDVTLLNCAYGAASEIDQTSYSGSGTFINTNPIVSLALGISSDGNVTGAPLAGAGNKWWTSPVPVDKDGEEFMDPPAIGADANYGSGYLPSVDFNSVSPQRLRRLRNARQRQF
jgi:hypothetical protein